MTIAFDPSAYQPQHFMWQFAGGVAYLTLNRPEKKNPLTFDSYAELRDLFQNLLTCHEVRVVVISGAGGNFCSGGDVHEIIGPLTKMDKAELLDFTHMTGDLIKAIRNCPQLVISKIEGICAGAGAAIAMASDLRYGTADSKVAFLFVRVGLAGCDMGACAILPRLIGHGRATELLLSGRSMEAQQALEWGFYNGIVSDSEVEVREIAARYAQGPTFAYAMTKKMLNEEWDMQLDEAVSVEAEAQALCMQTQDFKRAYEAFSNKTKPEFKGD